MKIKEINKIKNVNKKYDIQVAENHNFFANNILVHNCNMYNDHFHARSLDSNNHPSRNYVKGIWGSIKSDIPQDWRICGENLYARHSLGYDNLESYFMCFSIWNADNMCLDIDQTLEWCKLLGIVHVPILYRGVFDLDFIKNFKVDTSVQEGFVIRLAREFHYDDFSKSVVKWVRKGHVAPNSGHWQSKEIIPNKLKI